MAPEDNSTPLQTMSYWIALSENLLLVRSLEREELVDRQVRHRERIVREVDLLVFLVPFIHRKVDDPAQFEAVLGRRAKLFANLGARRSGEFDELRGSPATKNTASPSFKPSCWRKFAVRSAPRLLATGPRPTTAPLSSAQKI